MSEAKSTELSTTDLSKIESLREEVAKLVYEADPIIDPGESMDGFQIYGPGPLPWDSVCEFPEDHKDLINQCHETAEAILIAVQSAEKGHLMPYVELTCRGLEIETLRKKVREWEQHFDLYDSAMRRGVKMWQEKTGKMGEWPDSAVNIADILEETESLRAQVAALKAALKPFADPRIVAVQMVDGWTRNVGIETEDAAALLKEGED